MSGSKENVRHAFPNAVAQQNYMEGGFYIDSMDPNVNRAFLGEGLTQQEAWDNAASRLLALNLET